MTSASGKPASRRLKLETLYNVRDLGGYPALDGKITAFGKFLRADAPF
ncbi:MAG TPA: protein-tyrosine-phosphatase, partial [Clostridiales bacterium]|nr:protein-tyrosine-phosphatase [Clostridiales bacterium]